MQRIQRLTTKMGFLAIALASASAASLDRTIFAPITIDLPPGMVVNTPNALNDKAYVVGTAYTSTDWLTGSAFLWTPAGTVLLPGLNEEGFARMPFSINNHDQVAGMDYLGSLVDSPMDAWYWESGMDKVRVLEPLRADDTWVGARMINDAARIVGFSGPVLLEAEDAVYWAAYDAAPAKLKTLPRSPKITGALAMNNNDPPQIVGWCGDVVKDNVLQESEALFWSSPAADPYVLPKLPGGHEAMARFINDKGQVAGYCSDAEGRWQAVLWQKGEVISLAPGSAESYVAGGNNRGQFVGYLVTEQGDYLAVLWTVKGKTVETIDLNEQIAGPAPAQFYLADGINDDGYIIVDGVDAEGLNRAYLLVPSKER